ncbi:uncharacterized protein LOC116262811 [Nymphaea colorata]|nr:uncharacterized protein LOC116262811 [Nymphaea colorata]XP_049935996.1 uncharacterized protein LOC116262811 [Nymphaea colorata]
MLISVEGGFISSSASGYSKGLALLLFWIGGGGRRRRRRRRRRGWTDDSPMRVLPWNRQYQLVSQEEITAEYPLAPAEHRAKTRRVCKPFLCFGRPPPPGLDGPPSPLKVEPVVHQQEYSSTSPSGVIAGTADGVDELGVKVFQKSSLKKPSAGGSDGGGPAAKEVEGENDESSVLDTAAKRKVQWTDGWGRDLTEIREFEPSEMNESEDEDDDGRGCSCVIQ